MRFSSILILLLYTPFLTAQEVSGKIYSNTTVGNTIKVKNITRDYISYSTKMGDFSIKAQLQDTLIFGENLSQPKSFIVDSMALQHPVKINIKEKRFLLKKVVLTTKYHDMPDIQKYNQSLKQKLNKDKQKNSYLYRPSHGNIGNLYLSVVKGIKNLIGQSKIKNELISYITADDLKKLFTNDSLFNESLLQKTLKIPVEKTYLFFVYCEDQHLEGALLKEDHRFQLLNKLVLLSKKF